METQLHEALNTGASDSTPIRAVAASQKEVGRQNPLGVVPEADGSERRPNGDGHDIVCDAINLLATAKLDQRNGDEVSTIEGKMSWSGAGSSFHSSLFDQSSRKKHSVDVDTQSKTTTGSSFLQRIDWESKLVDSSVDYSAMDTEPGNAEKDDSDGSMTRHVDRPIHENDEEDMSLDLSERYDREVASQSEPRAVPSTFGGATTRQESSQSQNDAVHDEPATSVQKELDVPAHRHRNTDLWLSCLAQDRKWLQRLLVDDEIDIDTRDDAGKTALHWAAEDGLLDAVLMLTEHGANINTKDKSGDTPLHLASRRFQNRAVVAALLNRGASVFIRNVSQQTALHSAVTTVGDCDIMTLLIENRIEVDAQDLWGETALYLASQNGLDNAVRLLIAKRASVDTPTVRKLTALHIASERGQLEVVRSLVQHTKAIDAQDNQCFTPMMIATDNNHPKVVSCLLDGGAFVDAMEEDDWTALHFASRKGMTKIITILLDNDATVDAKTNLGRTPLHYASRNGHIDAVSILVKNGAVVDAKDNDGSTALHFASMSDHCPVIDFVLDGGIPVDIPDKDEATALHCASLEGHIGAVRSLVERGACIHKRTIGNLTPLDLATMSNRTKVVEFLASRLRASMDDDSHNNSNNNSNTEQHRAAGIGSKPT